MIIPKSAALSVVLGVLSVVGNVGAASEAFMQCAGEGYLGSRECIEGYVCRFINKYYSQCLPETRAETTPPPPEVFNTDDPYPPVPPSAAIPWLHFPAPTHNDADLRNQNPWLDYFRRPTGRDSGVGARPTSSSFTPTQKWRRRSVDLEKPQPQPQPQPRFAQQAPELVPVASPPRKCPITPPPSRPPPLRYKGMNIAGFNLPITSLGRTLPSTPLFPPLVELGGPDGAGQMHHFAHDLGHNMFRLPVTWQYLTGGRGGSALDEVAWVQYDRLVERCLESSKVARCVVDLHNFGRYEGEIIGDANGPSISTFATLWSNISTRYANNTRILFSLMNAPHSIPPSSTHTHTFLTTIQSAVHAIRNATRSTSHTILLPSMDWSDPGTFHTDVGGGPALLNVKNPDGSTRGLVFDVQVFPGGKGEFGGVNGDESGDGDACPDEDSNPSAHLIAFTQFLRCNGRKALVSAIGGGSGSPRCLKYVCGVTDFVKANSDVYLGFLGWTAGASSSSPSSSSSFSSRSPHSPNLSPTLWFNGWKDAEVVSLCLT